MEQLKDPKKMILWLLIAIIIISGIITVATKGFNVELRYTAHKTIELTIGETVNVEQIQSKADEVFGKGKSIVQIVEVYKDTVQITAKDIIEEQKNSMVSKINELYPQEVPEGEEAKVLIDASKVTIRGSENARLRDFLKPYIIPVAVVTVIVLAYYSILYRKLGVLKVLLKAVLSISVGQAVLLSMLALTRFPMGRLTSPLILLVYVISLINISGSLIKAQKAKV